MTKKRIDWIDIVKGIGILLVLIFHAVPLTTPPRSFLNTVAYSFHLPLFFIIGGYTIKEISLVKDNVKNIVFKNLKNIILPYYFYTFFILIIELLKNFIQKDFTVQGTVNLICDYIFLKGLKADWFLPALFYAKTLFELAYIYIIKNHKLLYLLLPICAIAVMFIPQQYKYLHCIICGVIGCFFVSIGFYIKKLNIKLKWQYMIVISVIWIISTYFNKKVSLLALEYGNSIILCLLNGILGTLIVIYFSQHIEKFKVLKKPFVYMGKYSLVIMVIHMEIIAVLNEVFNRISFMKSHNSLSIIAVIIITLSASLIISPIIDKIYKKIIK